jgi:hypothetical protein
VSTGSSEAQPLQEATAKSRGGLRQKDLISLPPGRHHDSTVPGLHLHVRITPAGAMSRT